MGLDTLFIIFVLVMSVVLHEVAHGYVAYRCGDPTAAREGRLTLNPIPHIDPFMTVILPAALYYTTGMWFGGAKPVPVNFFNLRRWPRDVILVSLAGIATNLAIAVVLGALVRMPFLGRETRLLLYEGALLNIMLAVFNLVPIPPLDGSRAFRFLLPDEAKRSYDSIEPFGFIFIIVLLNLGILQRLIHPALALLRTLILPG